MRIVHELDCITRVNIVLTKVKTCNRLWRMLLLCILNYLELFMRYTFSIFDTDHLDTIFTPSKIRICVFDIRNQKGALKQNIL